MNRFKSLFCIDFLQCLWVFSQNKTKILQSLFAILLSTVIIFFIPFFIRMGIESINSKDYMSFLPFLYLLLAIFFLALISAWRLFYTRLIVQGIVSDIRLDAYKKLLMAPASFINSHHIGDILKRFDSDLDCIQSATSTSLVFAIRNIILFLGSMFFLFYIHFFLAFFCIPIIFLILLPLYILQKRFQSISKEVKDYEGDILSHLQERLASIFFVQVFNAIDFEWKKMNKMEKKRCKLLRGWFFLRGVLVFSIILLGLSGIVFLFWYALNLVHHESIAPSTLIQFVLLMVLSITTFSSFSDIWTDLQQANHALERIKEVLSIETNWSRKDGSLIEKKKLRSMQSFNQKMPVLSINSISFSYKERECLFSDFSCDVFQSETVAIRGRIGSGKSTLFQLLLRLQELKSGSICVYGCDITSLAAEDLYRLYSVVFQNTILFHGSILENMFYGLETPSLQKARYYADKLGIDSFINNLPDSYSTCITQNNQLSGGQRQMLSLCRMAIRGESCPFILLDEPTSALDQRSKNYVHSFLDQYLKDKTAIIVTHQDINISFDQTIFLKGS